MKPLGILVNAGAWFTLRMTGKIDGFRIGKISSLIMPDQTGVAGTVNEDKLHPNTCKTPWRIIFIAIAARNRLTTFDAALTPP